MRDSDFDVVRQLPLFCDMDGAHFDALLAAAHLQRLPKSTSLIQEGDLPDFLHIVVEGAVELFAESHGRETTIDILRPVTTFILAAVIRDEVYLKSARTLTQSRILMIPAKAVRDAFGRDAAFARAIVGELAIRYRSIVRTLKDHKLRTGVERLANWILTSEQEQGGRGRVVLSYDKRTLSARLGMSPEHLSRNLTHLAQHGVVGNGREIVITDRGALQRCAKADPLIDG